MALIVVHACTHQSNSYNVNQFDLLLVFQFPVMCPRRKRLIFGNQSSSSMRNATSLGIPLFKLGCMGGPALSGLLKDLKYLSLNAQNPKTKLLRGRISQQIFMERVY